MLFNLEPHILKSFTSSLTTLLSSFVLPPSALPFNGLRAARAQSRHATAGR